MAEQPQGGEQPQEQEQRGRGRGRGRGGRGFGRGRGQRRGGNRQNEEVFIPCTNLGRLVTEGLITKLEDIYFHSIPIKEYQIVDLLTTKNPLQEECMCVKSVQKQTKAGQRTRFKCVVCCGDANGHLGVGTKVSKEVQIAMKGASMAAKMNVIPVRRGYWGGRIGDPHTIPTKITGKCGSIRMRFIPAPRGTGIIGAPPTKKIMAFAGVKDVFSSSRGNTDTMENFVRAVYDALFRTYKYLTPDLWDVGEVEENIFTKNHDFLHKKKEEKTYQKEE